MKNLLLLLVFTLFTAPLNAWNGRGHMVIAAIAWDQLDEQSRAAITDLLKQHPAFARKWKGDYQAYEDDLPLGKFLMMRAATWPDQIRNGRHPDRAYHRGEWHYITYEMRAITSADKKELKVSTNLPRNKKGDVLYGIERALDLENLMGM